MTIITEKMYSVFHVQMQSSEQERLEVIREDLKC